MKNFHHSHFLLDDLLAQKKSLHQSVSVVIPTLNEAATIGTIVKCIRENLAELVDEILVIDSGSVDDTKREAEKNGATFFYSKDICPQFGTHIGKGENLWKSLFVSRGDTICFIDGDISNFHSGFVSGLLGALWSSDEIKYVKAHYLRENDGNLGGGRLTELLVRPFFKQFYPALTSFHQPLAGEYALRRDLAESLTFPTGYGVEVAHLLDVYQRFSDTAFAQVNMERRHHRNRSTKELSHAAEEILQVLLHRANRDGLLNCPLPAIMEREAKGIQASRL